MQEEEQEEIEGEQAKEEIKGEQAKEEIEGEQAKEEIEGEGEQAKEDIEGEQAKEEIEGEQAKGDKFVHREANCTREQRLADNKEADADLAAAPSQSQCMHRTLSVGA